METTPRRARQLIPADLAPGSRAVAGCAVLVVLAQLLLAQLTLAFAVVFAVTGRVSRWRPWWLTVPAAVGLCWALAIGLRSAGAGFAAGPAHVLGYLDQAGLLQRSTRPSGPFAGAAGWLPRQLPLALVAGAAEAALIGWLRPDPAMAPPRPGLVAAVRARLSGALIRAGAVVTREGCALGVAPATGAVVELGWAEAAGGVLVAGDAADEVTITSLQLAHAALRRRKPLIVIDVSDGVGIARALTAACAATGTPLRRYPPGGDLVPVISERSAALLRVGSPDAAAAACAGVAALATALRRIGVDGDALIWVTGGERLPASAVAALISAGRAAGLATVVGTTSATAAADLAGLAGAVLVHRIADPPSATALAGVANGEQRIAGDLASAPAPPGLGAAPAVPFGGARGALGESLMARGGASSAAVGISPGSPVSAGALLSLRRGEFVLALKGGRRRLVRRGRLVPARLPRAASRSRRARRERSATPCDAHGRRSGWHYATQAPGPASRQSTRWSVPR